MCSIFRFNIYCYHRLLQFLYPDYMNNAKKILKTPYLQVFLYFICFSYTVLIDLLRDKKVPRVANVGSFLKYTTVEEKRSPGNEAEKINYLNKMATSLLNLEGKGFLYFYEYAIMQAS